MKNLKKYNQGKTFTGLMIANDLRAWLADSAKRDNRSITGQIVHILSKARESAQTNKEVGNA